MEHQEKGQLENLPSLIRNTDVVICFDRFFTSVTLMKTLPYAAVGTCIGTRKNIPKGQGKLEKGEAKFVCTNDGITFTRWQDTKEVLAISNCHGNQLTCVYRKQKNGEKLAVACPEIISFYNKYIGGVGLTDHLSGLYEFDCKSTKWWKKVFYKLLMITAVNAFIIYNEVRRKNTHFFGFLGSLGRKPY